MSLGTPHYMSPSRRWASARSRPLGRPTPWARCCTNAHRRAAVHRRHRPGGGGASVTESPRPAHPPAPHHPRHVEAAAADGAREAPRDRVRDRRRVREALRDKSYVSTASILRPRPRGGRAGPSGRARRQACSFRHWAWRWPPATAAALWGWLRPAPVPLLSQFSLALKPNQRCSRRSQRRGAYRALARRRALAYIGREAHAPLAPAHGPSSTRRRSPAPRRLEPVLLARRRQGWVHQERHRGCGSRRWRARRRSR